MPNLKINGNVYAGVQKVQLPLSDDGFCEFAYIEPNPLNITKNGTHDVTHYGYVNVDVPTDGGDGGSFMVAEVVLANEHTSKTPKILCTIPYIGEHINDPGLFVLLMRKDTSEMTLSVSVAMACNSAFLNNSYSLSVLRSNYGLVGEYKTGAQEDYKVNNATGTAMNRVYADSAGNVYILPYSSYSFAAGTYIVIYGVL